VGSLPKSEVETASRPAGPTQIVPAAPASQAPVQGKPIGPITAGKLPDFVGADIPSALAVLRDTDLPYVVVDVPSKNVARGLVISQSPGAGSRSGADQVVTLVVSRGAP
jgi:hypothetical protein